jgi:putative acyl-CoA dehydrogenase
MSATHDVFNQSTPFVDRNLYAVDPALQDAMARFGAGWADAELKALGARLGCAEVMQWARLANTYPPQLRSFAPHGRFSCIRADSSCERRRYVTNTFTSG